MEEVQDILHQLGACFHYILTEANVIADGLAKEGAFRSTLIFLCSFLSFRFLGDFFLGLASCG